MELDQLKANWSQHNTLLEKNIALNEELLKNMQLDKAKSALQKPYVAEVLALFILSFTAILWATQIPSLAYNNLYLGMGILVLIVLISSAFIAWTKIKAAQKINFYKSDIITIQEGLVNFKTTVQKMVYFEVLLVTTLLMCLPAIFKVLKGKDLFELAHPTPVYIYLGITIFLITPLALWLIPKVYYKQIKNAEEMLKEIDEFKKEL